MSKVQPSERHKQSLNELLQGGVAQPQNSSDSSFIGSFITRAIQRFVTESLEQEVADFLGRDYYQRRDTNENLTGVPLRLEKPCLIVKSSFWMKMATK